jgi:hypothetical protein
MNAISCGMPNRNEEIDGSVALDSRELFSTARLG